MLDHTRADLSVLPNRAFFRAHSCLSSYTEAARLAPTGANIFDVAQYSDPQRPGENQPRFIGPFEVDLYQYPPAFLILPRTAAAAGLGFLTTRQAWFAIQSIVLYGRHGRSRPVDWWRKRPVGAAARADRVGVADDEAHTPDRQLPDHRVRAEHPGDDRVRPGTRGARRLRTWILGGEQDLPGILGISLLVERRWGAVAWTAAWSLFFTAAAWLAIGSTPFVDFIRYQLPRIESGAAFFWIENAAAAPINYGIHGLIIKLRFLGVPWTGPAAANRAASLYAVILVLLAFASAWRLKALAGGPWKASACGSEGAGVAGTPQPGVVPEPVRSRCLRARRHAVAADARGGGRPLAGARTERHSPSPRRCR